jgi:hypothetical protein
VPLEQQAPAVYLQSGDGFLGYELAAAGAEGGFEPSELVVAGVPEGRPPNRLTSPTKAVLVARTTLTATEVGSWLAPGRVQGGVMKR